MDPIVSFSFALVAIVISVVAGVAAWWAVGQTRKYQPRADIELGYDTSKVSGFEKVGDVNVPYVVATLMNYGPVAAKKVVITIDTATREGSGAWEVIMSLEEGATFTVPLFRVIGNAKDAGFQLVDDEREILHPTVTVTWRKEFSDGKTRTMKKQIKGEGY